MGGEFKRRLGEREGCQERIKRQSGAIESMYKKARQMMRQKIRFFERIDIFYKNS